ncbi:MAG TPA: acyl-CoA thioesterase [Polyangiaceae bacterium]|nr:acyl-CoA thioesterase [Polyangiaceae bacterium]
MTERTKKTPAQSRLSLHHLMLPEHANALGNVHGGMIMRWVDEAGAICAMRHAHAPCVTVAIDSMTFRQPVHVGELLSCSGIVTWVGKSSIEVEVHVHAENAVTGELTHTNSAFLVYVAIDSAGRPVSVPELELTSDEERQLFADGAERQRARLARAAAGQRSQHPPA